MTRSIETHTITWRGIVIDIHYEACWLGSDGPFSTAHLQVDVKRPERAPLPFTETGYRSHFTPAATIEDAGGPVEFVLAWLEHEAKSPAWKKQEEVARQMSLF